MSFHFDKEQPTNHLLNLNTISWLMRAYGRKFFAVSMYNWAIYWHKSEQITENKITKLCFYFFLPPLPPDAELDPCCWEPEPVPAVGTNRDKSSVFSANVTRCLSAARNTNSHEYIVVSGADWSSSDKDAIFGSFFFAADVAPRIVSFPMRISDSWESGSAVTLPAEE